MHPHTTVYRRCLWAGGQGNTARFTKASKASKEARFSSARACALRFVSTVVSISSLTCFSSRRQLRARVRTQVLLALWFQLVVWHASARARAHSGLVRMFVLWHAFVIDVVVSSVACFSSKLRAHVATRGHSRSLKSAKQIAKLQHVEGRGRERGR